MGTKRRVARIRKNVDVYTKKPKTKSYCHPTKLVVGMKIKDMPVVGYGKYCGTLVCVSASKCEVVWSDNTRGEYSHTHIAKYVISK